MPRKTRKKVRGIVKAGVVIGVGSAIVAGAGGHAGVQSALGTAGGMLRPMTIATMGKRTLDITKGYKVPKGLKRKRRRI